MDLLRATDNVLAIHGLNRTSGDADFLMLPEIVARGQSDDERQALLFHPNAGRANIAGFPRRGESSSPEGHDLCRAVPT